MTQHDRIDPAQDLGMAPAAHLHWVPVRALAPRHRPRILDHLLSLSVDDRYLRFGHPATDAHIGRYVDTIDFDRDEVFGVFNRRLRLLAVAHLAYIPATGQGRCGEFGVSVVEGSRGRGLGARMFDHAMLHARNRRVDTLYVQSLSSNTAMLRIARQAGALIEREGAETEAVVKLPPEDMVSHMEAAWWQRVAEIDYGWKRQNYRVQRWMNALAPSDDKKRVDFAHSESGGASAG